MTRLLLVWISMVASVALAQSPDGGQVEPIVKNAEPKEELAIGYKEMLKRNNANIGQLKMGMTKDQVMNVMRPYTAGRLTNPYRQEAFQRGGATYEVLWYLTKPHRTFVSIKDAQATPVVLKNGEVVGWGPTAVELAK